MSASCGHTHGPFDGMSADYRRRLWAVIAINAGMFVVEMAADISRAPRPCRRMRSISSPMPSPMACRSPSSAHRCGCAPRRRRPRVSACSSWASGSSLHHLPRLLYGAAGSACDGRHRLLALGANLASVLLLMNYKDGDANVRSVWLCSRNDAIGNVIVMLAAVGVWGTATAWPDLIVAAIMAGCSCLRPCRSFASPGASGARQKAQALPPRTTITMIILINPVMPLLRKTGHQH